MNNLAYMSQDASVVGGKVEEKVREETGSGSPVSYQVEMGQARTASAGSVLHDIGSALLGGGENLLFNLNFDLTQPRPAQLTVSVDRQGVGSYVGILLYSAKFARPVSGEIALEDPKMFGKSKFTGDAAITGKLNANGDLIKHANEFARVESQSGGLTLKIKRLCKIVPDGNGSMLVIGTLPRPTQMGFGATLDAKMFFDIANAVEAAL